MDFLADLAREYAALLVSICALFLTINQSMATRRHNRLTVKPDLTSFTEQLKDPERTQIVFVTAKLFNNGLGPAIIKSYEPLFDGVPINADDPDDLLPVVERALPLSLIRSECSFAVLRKGYVMAKDEQVTVAKLSVVPTLGVSEEVMKNALQRFQIRVTYESAYGDQFTYDSRQHRQTEKTPKSFAEKIRDALLIGRTC